MEYTLRYEMAYSDGHVSVKYPSTPYSDARSGGPVVYTGNPKSWRGTYNWKTYAGAKKNLRKYRPWAGDLVSETVVGIHEDGNIVEVEDLEEARRVAAEELALKLKAQEEWRKDYEREQAELRSKVQTLRSLLELHDLHGTILDYEAGLRLTYEQALAIFEKMEANVAVR